MNKKTYIIENRGKYRGIDWVVRFLDLGHRCGYVKIEDKAVFSKYEKEYAKNNFILSLDVHGGITFIRKLADGNEYGLSAGNWLGFDAAHHLDLNDYQCARKYFGNNERYDQCEQINFRYKIEGASIKTEDYMIAECKSLIDQILAKSVKSDQSVKFTQEVCREMYDALDECSCALEDVILHIMSGKGFDTVSSDNIIYVLQEAAEKAEQALKKARGEQ